MVLLVSLFYLFITQRISVFAGIVANLQNPIAILHAIANTPKHIQASEVTQSSWIQKFLQKCPRNMSSIEKATILEADNTIESYHEAATSDSSNQTNRPDMDENIDMHFATFVCVNGILYELDGRLDGPVCHGRTSQLSFLNDSCAVVREWMNADRDELRFTMLALAPSTAIS